MLGVSQIMQAIGKPHRTAEAREGLHGAVPSIPRARIRSSPLGKKNVLWQTLAASEYTP